MSRTKLELPAKFDFTLEFPLRMADINAGGHLAASSILPLTTEAKLIFLRKLGFTELNIDGYGIIMADAFLVFEAQAYYGQTIKIEIAVQNFARKSCNFFYRITDTKTGVEIARVKTTLVFFDYKAQKSAEVPARFRQIFEKE